MKKDLDALSLRNRSIRDDLITDHDHRKVRKGMALKYSQSFWKPKKAIKPLQEEYVPINSCY